MITSLTDDELINAKLIRMIIDVVNDEGIIVRNETYLTQEFVDQSTDTGIASLIKRQIKGLQNL